MKAHTHTHTRTARFSWMTRGAGVPLMIAKCVYAFVCMRFFEKNSFFLKHNGLFLRITLLVNHSMNTSLLSEKNAFQNEGFNHSVFSLLPFYRSSYALLNAMMWNFNSVLWLLSNFSSAQESPFCTSGCSLDADGAAVGFWHSFWSGWCLLAQFQTSVVHFDGLPTWSCEESPDLGLGALKGLLKNEKPLTWQQRIEQFVMHQ